MSLYGITQEMAAKKQIILTNFKIHVFISDSVCVIMNCLKAYLLVFLIQTNDQEAINKIDTIKK